MEIGPRGKKVSLSIILNKNKMQLRFQMNRLMLTIQLKINCSWVILKVLKVTMGLSLCPVMKQYYWTSCD